MMEKLTDLYETVLSHSPYKIKKKLYKTWKMSHQDIQNS